MVKKKKLDNRIENEKILKKIDEYNNNGKRTIAIFCDAWYPAVDGVIKVFENHAKHLSKENNVVMCVPKHGKKTVENDRDYLVIGVNSLDVSGKVGYDCAFPNLDDFFNKVMKKVRIDLIHFHSPFLMGAYAVSLAKKKKVPVIGTFHTMYKDEFYRNTKSNSISQILTSIIVKVFSKSNLILTMNDFSANILREYGYKGEIKILPNATDFSLNDNIEDKVKELRQVYNIDDDEVVFSYLGRIVKEKKLFFLLDVFKILKEKGLKFRMFFIGHGLDFNKLKKKVDEYGLNENVVMTGLVKDTTQKAALLNMSDLFLFPSTFDTDGIVKIEAACVKVPSLCISGTGAASTIKDNVNGFLTELDENVFADRIIEIISNKEKLKIVGQNAFNDLYITWDEVVQRIFTIYNEEIEKNKLRYFKKKRENF